MKKLIALICMITCVLGLAACGKEEALTEYEQVKVEHAREIATERVIPVLMAYSDETIRADLADYTSEEIAYALASSSYALNVDGYAFVKAVDSFADTMEDMGQPVSVGEATAHIKDDEILVYVQMSGKDKNAEAELIFSNDTFFMLESGALNLKESMGELMARAAMNTLIGMGTVFLVLILISLIISCFGIIPKIQKGISKRKEQKQREKTTQHTGIENGVAQIVGQEEKSNVVSDDTDDLELVAVIAAAIAASEGRSSSDGFVVRSIRRRA